MNSSIEFRYPATAAILIMLILFGYQAPAWQVQLLSRQYSICRKTRGGRSAMYVSLILTILRSQYKLGRVWEAPEGAGLNISSRVVHGSDGPAGRVGSSHDFSGFWRVGSGRVGSGQHFGFFKFFTDYFSVPESIWIFEYYIRNDWISTIFDI